MKKILILAIALTAINTVCAAESSGNPFMDALTNGSGTAELPNDRRYASVVKTIQEKTGSTEPIMINSRLLKKFKQQPRCGRVVFVMTQGNVGWKELGGQLNICEDGTPPMQACPEAPDKLVPYGTKCADGQPAKNTKEVDDAIREAITGGSLSYEQARATATKSK